jgi:2-dehydro-3-deoxygluconokinase
MTAVGADQPGESFLALWQRGGRHQRGPRSPVAHTGLYFVTHGADGHVFSYMRAGSAASRMTPEDLPEAMIRGARAIHASGISQAISSSAADAVFTAMRMARAAGVLVSYDTNLRLRLWPLERARPSSSRGVARRHRAARLTMRCT